MSKLADYATVVMSQMARDPEAVHSAADLAARLDIGAPTVSKILKILGRGGLAVSVRGARGGYRLPGAPSSISVARIIRAVDGPIGVTECSTTPGLCAQESRCTLRANWVRVNHIVLEVLDGISLEQLNRSIAGTVKVESIGRPGGRAAAARRTQ